LLSACGSPPVVPARAPETTSLRAPVGCEHKTGFFEGARGARLFEQYWRPENPAAVLVVVHGLKDHSSRYEAAALRLAEQGYAVYAFDLRGHAHSDGMRVYVDSFEDYVSDLDIFMKRVEAREPHKPIFLFGHSMGGLIATLYTEERQPNLAGLLLSGAALKADVSWFKATGTRMVNFFSPRAGVWNLDMKDFSRDPAVVKSGETDSLVYQDGAPAHTATEVLSAIDRAREGVSKLNAPLLLMHGSLDRITSPEGSKEVYAQAPSSDKTLKIYDGLYHDLLHEPEKDRPFGDILAWLKKHTPAAPASPTPASSSTTPAAPAPSASPVSPAPAI
jgi:alpha-beta hydrolase superfamily lysophospholipase